MKIALRLTLLIAVLLASQQKLWAFGNSLNFNAANSSYVQIVRPVQNDFTIEFWVNTTMTSPTGANWWQGAGLVDGETAGAANDFGTSLLNGKLAFGVGNPDVTIQSITSINDGKWHHVAITRTQSTGQMLLYIDGVQEATGTGNTNALIAPANMRLGSIQTGTAGNFFTGQLDEVRFWSSVRTQVQISANKNYQLGGTGSPSTAGLVANYRLDDGNPSITTVSTGTSATTGTFPPAAANYPTWVVPSTAPVYSTTNTITGTVFDDVNYGGGAGRSLATATSSAFGFKVGRPGATVELYNAVGGTLVAATTTDASGFYGFSSLNPNLVGGYTVRVVSSTVTSARTGNTAGLLPVVTSQYTFTDQVGGPNPDLPDAPANSGGTTPTLFATLNNKTTQAVEAQSAASASGSGVTSGVDFGFNFDLIVNTKDAGQGSLRQFITNANALGNESQLVQAGSYRSQVVGANPQNVSLPTATESSIFMIPSGTAVPGLRAVTGPGPANQLTNGVAVITPASALPSVAGVSTAINGGTQSFNVGDTNTATLGTGGTVGTNGALLNQLSGPEVQLTGSTSVAIGLNLLNGASGSSIIGLAIYGFGSTGVGSLDSNTAANILTNANNVTLAQNVVGTTATAFTSPSTITNADNIRLTGGSGIMIINNLIGFSNSKGIAVNQLVSGATVMNNEVRSNGQAGANYDGIDIQGNGAVVTNNLFINNTGQGIDSYRSAGTNTITGNTISGNGRGISSGLGETPGVRIYGANNTISQNIVSGNYGAGIFLEGLTNGGNTAAVSTTLISQNSIFNNGAVTAANNTAASGQIGIDLAANGNNESAGTAPFVTLNSTSTAGANGLLNYPILQTARINGNNLVVSGLATAGVTVEVFVATPNAVTTAGATTGNNFGQGSTYLGSAVATSSGIVNSYGPGAVNGFAQGSGTNTNYFIIVIPLTAAQRATLASGTLITSTATLSNTTSEFSGNVAITPGPSAFNLSNLNVGANAASNALNPGLTVPQAASDPNGTIASFTVFPATNGTLLYNGAAIPTTGQTILAANTGLLTFQPTNGFTGNAMFSFTATNTAGTASNQAVYTIPVINSGNGFVANDDGLDAAQNTSTSGNLILNDTNTNNTTTFSVNQVTGPTHGTLTLTASTGVYTYTPATDYLGPDSFQYQVCTTAGTTTTCSNIATVSINVYDPVQVCSAATGPNLLVNPGFESGNTGFTSAYTFVAHPAAKVTDGTNGLYPEGRYAVDADANYYHANFTGTPHSGSTFMIVNGAANLSQVYAQVVNVVPGRYYTFSGYATSVNEASPAVLGFVINGKSASISTTLPTTRNSYVQFSGVWYSGTSRTAAFEVRDINRAAGGNDFGIDDLYFGTCNVNLLAVTKNNPSVSSQTAATNLIPMEATLTSTGVSIASLVIQTLPAAGTLRLGGANGTVVTTGQVIAYDQRGTLYYAPVTSSSGNQSFTYTAIDSEGAGSGNIATFTIPVTAAPLPVTLTSFTAQAVGNAALVTWTTASELANAYFEVERSTSGQTADFVAIGRVAGKGTATTANSYQLLDRAAADAGSLVYYRLRQVDVDGTSTYSPVRAVTFGKLAVGPLSLYPNPSAGTDTNLDLSSLPTTAAYQVHLLDATGRTVRQWVLSGGQPRPLAVADLASGTYLLLISGTRADGSALRQVLHFTKE